MLLSFLMLNYLYWCDYLLHNSRGNNFDLFYLWLHYWDSNWFLHILGRLLSHFLHHFLLFQLYLMHLLNPYPFLLDTFLHYLFDYLLIFDFLVFLSLFLKCN